MDLSWTNFLAALVATRRMIGTTVGTVLSIGLMFGTPTGLPRTFVRHTAGMAEHEGRPCDLHGSAAGPMRPSVRHEALPPPTEDVAVTSITNIPSLLCDVDSVAPVITLKNNGSSLLETALIVYTINGGATYEHPWTGALLTGQTTTVMLAPIPAVPGSNTLVVTASAPNGLTDQELGNDTWSIDFIANFPAGIVNLILTLDGRGSDVTWQLRTSDNTVIGEGGPYEDGDNGEVDSVAFCLTNGCYTFTIHDFFGDGICCAEGEGSYVLRDANGVVHGESDGQYGEQHVSNFCLEAVAVEGPQRPAFLLHPNPNAGEFRITTLDGGSIRSIRILDGIGRTVLLEQGAGSPVVNTRLDARPGAYTVVVESKHGRTVQRMVVTR